MNPPSNLSVAQQADLFDRGFASQYRLDFHLHERNGKWPRHTVSFGVPGWWGIDTHPCIIKGMPAKKGTKVWILFFSPEASTELSVSDIFRTKEDAINYLYNVLGWTSPSDDQRIQDLIDGTEFSRESSGLLQIELP